MKAIILVVLMAFSGVMGGVVKGQYNGFDLYTHDAGVILDESPVSVDSMVAFFGDGVSYTLYPSNFYTEGKVVYFDPFEMLDTVGGDNKPTNVVGINDFLANVHWQAYGSFKKVSKLPKPTGSTVVILSSGSFFWAENPLEDKKEQVTELINSIPDFTKRDTIRIEVDIEGLSIVETRAKTGPGTYTSTGIWNIPTSKFMEYLENYVRYGKRQLWLVDGGDKSQYRAAVDYMKGCGWPVERASNKNSADVFIEVDWNKHEVVSLVFK